MKTQVIVDALRLLYSRLGDGFENSHAAEDRYCPDCVTPDESYTSQQEHHPGCAFMATKEYVASLLLDLDKDPFHPATDDIIDFLDRLRTLDPKFMTDLCEARVPCNEAIANHPTVQTVGPAHACGGAIAKAGVLGVLNGFCGVFPDGPRKGCGAILAEYSDHRLLAEFRRGKNEHEPKA